MKRKTYILASLILTAFFGSLTIWNWSASRVSAQKSDDIGVITVASEYNARNEFSLTQGGTSGVWRYGYTANNASNAFVPYTLSNVSTCGGSPSNGWIFSTGGDTTPVLYRFDSPANCIGTPPDSLFVHPGANGERVLLRFVAPAAGTYQLTGVLQRADASATTDLRVLKNETTSLFTGSIVSTYQQSFNLTVTLAANETVDFSVGFGNGTYNSDGSALNVVVSQPPTACLTAPANLQVNVPAENSPVDVQSVNTNASLVGDATYTNMGKVSRAFDLDGSGDYVRIEDNAAQRPANALTLEGWFKFDAVGGIISLISKPIRGSALNSYTLYLQDGQLRGLIGNASQYTRALSNFSPQTGVWQHLAFTYDFSGGVSTLKLYANGTDVTSSVDGTANLPLFYDANPFPLLIGGEYENNAPGFTLDGQADEVSVYGRALAQTEIFDIVQAGSFGKCPPASCVQSPNNLVSWYAGESNALDSRSNNHATLFNGATFQNGRVGQGFRFDGADDYVAAPDSDSLDITGDLTLEAWVNPATTSQSATIVDKRDPSNTNLNYVLFLLNGELRFASRSGGGAFNENFSGVTLPAGTFSHVAVTIQNGSLRFYVNGVSSAALTTAATRSASTGRLIIGATETGSLSGFFNGSIDEISIYNRALTAAEISSIYNAGQSGKCKPSPLNPPTNQIAWFAGDGDARDFLGLNPNGILRGDANFKVGKVGQTFNFDGSGDYVEIADDADHRPATQLTAEGWFKFNNFNNIPHLVAKGLRGNDRDSYVMWFANGNIRIGYSDSSSNMFVYDTGFAPNAGEWNHYAMVLNTDDAGANANTFKLYVGGREVYSNAAAGPIYYDTVNPHPLTIGADVNNDVPDFPLNGQADEVSLYSRALSASEIAAVYNAGAAGKLKSVATPVNFVRNAKTASSLTPTTVQLSDATVTFAQVTAAGTTSQSGIDLGSLPKLPGGYTFSGLAYDISTTAGYQNGSADDVQVCFNVPALNNFNFADLRILHLENGVWVNRTAIGNTSPNLCTNDLTSLSPFVIAQVAATAANAAVSGRVTDALGVGLRNVFVTLTDSRGNSVMVKTNNFGRYIFENLAVGDFYVVGAASKKYSFAVPTLVLSVQEAVENVNFTANEMQSEQ